MANLDGQLLMQQFDALVDTLQLDVSQPVADLFIQRLRVALDWRDPVLSLAPPWQAPMPPAGHGSAAMWTRLLHTFERVAAGEPLMSVAPVSCAAELTAVLAQGGAPPVAELDVKMYPAPNFDDKRDPCMKVRHFLPSKPNKSVLEEMKRTYLKAQILPPWREERIRVEDVLRAGYFLHCTLPLRPLAEDMHDHFDLSHFGRGISTTGVLIACVHHTEHEQVLRTALLLQQLTEQTGLAVALLLLALDGQHQAMHASLLAWLVGSVHSATLVPDVLILAEHHLRASARPYLVCVRDSHNDLFQCTAKVNAFKSLLRGRVTNARLPQAQRDLAQQDLAEIRLLKRMRERGKLDLLLRAATSQQVRKELEAAEAHENKLITFVELAKKPDSVVEAKMLDSIRQIIRKAHAEKDLGRLRRFAQSMRLCEGLDYNVKPAGQDKKLEDYLLKFSMANFNTIRKRWLENEQFLKADAISKLKWLELDYICNDTLKGYCYATDRENGLQRRDYTRVDTRAQEPARTRQGNDLYWNAIRAADSKHEVLLYAVGAAADAQGRPAWPRPEHVLVLPDWSPRSRARKHSDQWKVDHAADGEWFTAPMRQAGDQGFVKLIYTIDAGHEFKSRVWLSAERYNADAGRRKRPAHSQLAGGGPVIAAGELHLRCVRGAGRTHWYITEINNGSGHFRPNTATLKLTHQLLKQALPSYFAHHDRAFITRRRNTVGTGVPMFSQWLP